MELRGLAFQLLTFLLVLLWADFAFGLDGVSGFLSPSKTLLPFAPPSLDLSFVKMQLRSGGPSGNLVEELDCAPNGYFFQPLYDSGIYFLVPSGVDGYYFSPSSVQLNFDSNSHSIKCSTSSGTVNCENIDFELTGFSLKGSVKAEACTRGIKGIKIELNSANGIQKTSITDSAGSFVFHDITPTAKNTQITLRASSENIDVDSTPQTVEVGFKPTIVEKPFVVNGFNVIGDVVDTHGNKVPGVEITLKDKKDPSKTSRTRTDLRGEFHFRSVTCGQFELSAEISSSSTKYVINPSKRDVVVDGEEVKLERPFEVTGFAWGGRVVSSPAQGLSGARVSVSPSSSGPDRVSVTDSSGYFTIDEMTAGTYTIKVEKENYIFADIKNVNIGPQDPKFGEIYPQKVKVSGELIVNDDADGLQIEAIKDNQSVEKTRCVKNKFEFYLEKGRWFIRPTSSSKFVLMPKQIEIAVDLTNPINNLSFSVSKVKVSGTVKCLKVPCDASGLSVVMTSSIDPSNKMVTGLEMISSSDSFVFRDVVPSTYIITISHKNWCWINPKIDLVVAGEDITDLSFVQEGYLVSIESNIDVQLDSFIKNSNNLLTKINVKEGRNEFCISNNINNNNDNSNSNNNREGTHNNEIVFKLNNNCIFHENLTYNINSPKILQLNVQNYVINGLIQGVIGDFSEISIQVGEYDSNNEIKSTNTYKVEGNTGKFNIKTQNSVKYNISPISKTLFFNPKSIDFYFDSRKDCDKVIKFEAKQGIYYHGHIEPAMEGVRVELRERGEGGLVLHGTSGRDGSFSLGPVVLDLPVSFSASLDGFNFIEQSVGDKIIFKSVQLGKIIAKLIDQDTNKPIEKVMVSLSSRSGYATRTETNPEGKAEFTGLFPAEFVVKAILREFSFKPSYLSVSLQGGDVKEVEITGKRTSYSVFGRVVSLNNSPERNVLIDAIGKSDRTDTRSDIEGNFRIRGLEPNETYTIQIAEESSRSSPAQFQITMKQEDSFGHEFVLLRKPKKGSAVIILNLHSISDSTTITATLYDSNKEEVILSKPFGLIPFTEFNGLELDKQYRVFISSTANKKEFEVPDAKEILFTLNNDSIRTELNVDFPITRKLFSRRIIHGSSFPLIVAILVAVAVYQHKKLQIGFEYAKAQLQIYLKKESKKTQQSNKPKHKQKTK